MFYEKGLALFICINHPPKAQVESMKERLKTSPDKFVLSFQLETGSKTQMLELVALFRNIRSSPHHWNHSTYTARSTQIMDLVAINHEMKKWPVPSAFQNYLCRYQVLFITTSLCRLEMKHLDLIRATLNIHICVGVPCLELGVTPWPKVNGGKGRQLENNSRSKSVSSSSQSTSSTTPNADSP